jgi:outer membrane lipoprotein
MRALSVIAALFLIVLSAGCATSGGSDATAGGPYPEDLAASPRLVPQGEPLEWGGRIVDVRNYAERTVIEVLAYPLDGGGQPNLSTTPRGRFLADRDGFLEPGEYKAGRALTVSGKLLGYEDGTVGTAPYRYPAISADRLELWPEPVSYGLPRPRVGVGVSGGSRGTGVGISVGF